MAKLVPGTYGDALFELAVEMGKLDSFLDEAKAVVAAIATNDEFNRMMNHPKIVKEDKISTIEAIFKGRISDELLGLMVQLVTKGHTAEMKAVFEHFIDRAKEYKRIGTVYVTTVIELNEIQKHDLVEKLKSTTEYESFEIHYNQDPSLIGGMVIRIKDRVVDSSIRTKLESLKSDLSKIQLKVGESTP